MAESSFPETHNGAVEWAKGDSHFGLSLILVDLLESIYKSLAPRYRTTTNCLCYYIFFCNHKAYGAAVVKKIKLFT